MKRHLAESSMIERKNRTTVNKQEILLNYVKLVAYSWQCFLSLFLNMRCKQLLKMIETAARLCLIPRNVILILCFFSTSLLF